MTYDDPVQYAVPFFIALILAEMIVGRFSKKISFEPKDTAASLLMGVGSTITGALFFGVALSFYMWGYQYRLFDLGTEWWVWGLCFFIDDLRYYIYHRVGHRVRWVWASHINHHSSQHYNLSTALRQTWTDFFTGSFLFRLPLVLIGFDPAMILFCWGINLIYQFWIHTETITSLGPIEWVMNTPSHHRVHHATNPRYLDSNYAGVFIIWDRMFGTFVKEDVSDLPQYGIVHNLGTFNLLRVAFHEWSGLFRDLWNANNWTERFGYAFRPPGWSPDRSRMTTEMIKDRWRAKSAERQGGD